MQRAVITLMTLSCQSASNDKLRQNCTENWTLGHQREMIQLEQQNPTTMRVTNKYCTSRQITSTKMSYFWQHWASKLTLLWHSSREENLIIKADCWPQLQSLHLCGENQVSTVLVQRANLIVVTLRLWPLRQVRVEIKDTTAARVSPLYWIL